MRRWGFFQTRRASDAHVEQRMKQCHLLECKLMGDPVSRSDLAAYNKKAGRCVSEVEELLYRVIDTI